MPSNGYFDGVEHIWVMWAVSLAAVFWGLWRMLRTINLRAIRRFWVAEEGAAYTLSYVLVFPLYLLMVVVAMQTTVILITKMGVVYAAYCGARSACVYHGLDGGSAVFRQYAERKVRQAVAGALTPFANSSSYHAQLLGIATTGNDANAADKYYETYMKLINGDDGEGSGPVNKAYLTAKYRFAIAPQATHILIEAPPMTNSQKPWTKDVAVTVTYKCPFDAPVVGRWIGDQVTVPLASGGNGGTYYYIAIASTAKLQYEVPKTHDVKLQIPEVVDPVLPQF